MAKVIRRKSRGQSPFSTQNWRKGWEIKALYSATAILIVFGLISLYSASSYHAQKLHLSDTYFFVRQSIGAGIGLIVLLICSRINYDIWRKMAWPIIGATWVLLVLLVLPGEYSFAPEINGAKRWLRIAGMTLQPSELAKIAIIIWTASLAVKKQNQFKSLRSGFLPFAVIWVAVMMPIALEPDMTTSMLVGALGCLVLFLAGGRFGHFIFMMIPLSPFLYVQLMAGFRLQRLKTFFDSVVMGPLDASFDLAGAGYQIRQSLYAIGSGGLSGVGFEQGRQKLGFLPEGHNDFIFAMIGEEWGFFGVIFLVTMYMVIVGLGFHIASKASDQMGQLLAIGISSLIAIQAILHMAVGLGLFPTTGLALPFISYGRSNLLVSMACIGILVNIARPPQGTYMRRRRARA